MSTLPVWSLTCSDLPVSLSLSFLTAYYHFPVTWSEILFILCWMTLRSMFPNYSHYFTQDLIMFCKISNSSPFFILKYIIPCHIVFAFGSEISIFSFIMDLMIMWPVCEGQWASLLPTIPHSCRMPVLVMPVILMLGNGSCFWAEANSCNIEALLSSGDPVLFVWPLL